MLRTSSNFGGGDACVIVLITHLSASAHHHPQGAGLVGDPVRVVWVCTGEKERKKRVKETQEQNIAYLGDGDYRRGLRGSVLSEFYGSSSYYCG